MVAAAFIATWWAGIGLVVGANKARWLPGPTDGLGDALLWAVGWPFLWLYEASHGE